MSVCVNIVWFALELMIHFNFVRNGDSTLNNMELVRQKDWESDYLAALYPMESDSVWDREKKSFTLKERITTLPL